MTSIDDTELCSGYGQWHTNSPATLNPKPYNSITLSDIVGLVETPPSVAKENAQWFIPSTLLSREAEKQRAHGRYHAVWCDFDHHTLLTAIQSVLASLLCSHVIYSSRSSTLNRQKWRVIIPLATPANAIEWQQVAAILNDSFEQAYIIPDRASERVNQICYLPNKGEFYRFHIESKLGPLNWYGALADELTKKRRQADQEKLRLEQFKEQSRLKAIERMATGSHSPIDAYNESYPVMQCLELYGYKRIGKKYLSPNSESGNAGVTIQGNRWMSSHSSDVGIGHPNKNGGGCYGDAFDLFVYYEHGGNHNAALQAAGALFTVNGKTLSKANQQAYRATQSPAKADKNLTAVSSAVPLKIEMEEVSLTSKNLNKNPKKLKPVSEFENLEGTERTEGTTNNGVASPGSPEKNSEGTGGIRFNSDDVIDDPLPDADKNRVEQLSFDDLSMPCFIVKDDWFYLGGKRKPGVWYCYETEGSKNKEPAQIALRICSPLYVVSVTNTENGKFFGRLLRFRNTLGCWINWAMPMELLRGSCEELRGELLAAGVEIEQRNRNHLATYLQWQVPKEVTTAATRTGWTAKGGAFVFHDRIIGTEKVHFQSESLSADGAVRTGGDYRQWQTMAALCASNPVLMVSVCVALAGALLVKVHRDSGGVHWVGDSSIGKTTALCVGASVWGGDDFKRTWRATSNGLEGVAALLSDTCLCLDEINEADPREVGAIVYSLGNGTGKTRATRIGSARQVHRWRLSLISTGERSISAMMQEGGKQAKAGQLVRLLNIPAARQFGVFDNLHHFDDGREMADYFKTECAKHYGHAGTKFVEHIIKQGNTDFGAILAKIETQFTHSDTQAARAASRFALYAMAGELAIEAGIVSWQEGMALDACKVMFSEWQSMRGTGATEHKQILQSVADYILKQGDTKFTDKNNPEDKPRADRAGWYIDKPGGRIYLFTSAALKEAGGNYDLNRILTALDSADWIIERDAGKRSKKTAITGVGKPGLYWIQPTDEGDHHA